jgi:hypothetical protein
LLVAVLAMELPLKSLLLDGGTFFFSPLPLGGRGKRRGKKAPIPATTGGHTRVIAGTDARFRFGTVILRT